MPDARLEKTRATLPAGYQYGDMRFAAEAHDMAVDEWFGDRLRYFSVGETVIVHARNIPSHALGKYCKACDLRARYYAN